jgi:hypothetical protein
MVNESNYSKVAIELNVNANAIKNDCTVKYCQ